MVEAVDRDFGRDVAVKMMLPGSAGSASVERFLLEAGTSRRAAQEFRRSVLPAYRSAGRSVDLPFAFVLAQASSSRARILASRASNTSDEEWNFFSLM